MTRETPKWKVHNNLLEITKWLSNLIYWFKEAPTWIRDKSISFNLSYQTTFIPCIVRIKSTYSFFFYSNPVPHQLRVHVLKSLLLLRPTTIDKAYNEIYTCIQTNILIHGIHDSKIMIICTNITSKNSNSPFFDLIKLQYTWWPMSMI